MMNPLKKPTNNLFLIGDVECGPDIGSDHIPIECSFEVNINRDDLTRPSKWLLKEVNWDEWKKKVKQKFVAKEIQYYPQTASELNHRIQECIISASEDSIKKSKTSPQGGRCTGWWDQECSKLVALRRKARNALRKSPTPANLTLYQEASRKAKKKINKRKKESWREFISTLDCQTTRGEVWKSLSCFVASFFHAASWIIHHWKGLANYYKTVTSFFENLEK